MGSPFNNSPASANSATWWSLMENSDTSDDEYNPRNGRRKIVSNASRAHGSAAYPDVAMGTSGTHTSSRKAASSSSRRSSAPLPRNPSPGDNPSHPSTRRNIERSHSDKMTKRNPQKTPSRDASRVSSVPSSPSPRPSLDDEDSEQKKIRWDTPTTHRYQLAEQPRLLEERFLNVLDSVQSMSCAQNFEKPLLTGSVWNLLDSNQNGGKDKERGNVEGNSRGHSSDDESGEESVFEDGPSVVEISGMPPVFSESITASESLFSSSNDSADNSNTERNDVTNRKHTASSKHTRSDSRDATSIPADSSQILDDLSGMESERNGVEYDNAPHKMGQEPIVVNNNDRPPVKIYNTAMPFEVAKEKKCIVSMGMLQDIHKSRSDAAAARKQYEANKKEHAAFRKKLKDSPHIPPIPDISVGESNEISTMSASEDSYMYYSKAKRHTFGRAQLRGIPVDAIPENKGLHIESNSKILFDNSYQDETRSCMPIRMQGKRRGADGATASSSAKSLGRRLFSRSGDANTTSEKENEIDADTDSPYVYEYESGINTYVAYFEISKPKDSGAVLQVIEHPNPPLLPFGSDEVVVKIEASTISQSDCAIRRGEWWGGTLSLPRIPGVAFSGKIDQIHRSGRNSMQRGDQVLSLVCSGSNSRYVCIPRERLVKVPANYNIDSTKLACLPEIYLSAFQALQTGRNSASRYRKNSLSGKSIMFVGGASGLGQAIIELGVEAGASVVYATASKVKQFQRIIEMGGIPLSDNPAEWLQSINQQVDILIGCTSDTLKDTDPLTYDHLNVLKKKGQLVLLSGPGAPNDHPVIHPGKAPCQVDVFKILKKAHKHNIFESWERDMKQGKKDLAHLIGLLQKGVLNPKILERISLNKVGKAEEIVEARRLHGVIMCEPWMQR